MNNIRFSINDLYYQWQRSENNTRFSINDLYYQYGEGGGAEAP